MRVHRHQEGEVGDDTPPVGNMKNNNRSDRKIILNNQRRHEKLEVLCLASHLEPHAQRSPTPQRSPNPWFQQIRLPNLPRSQLSEALNIVVTPARIAVHDTMILPGALLLHVLFS